MVVSPALPIQFWPSDCDTFNERVVPGINSTCWEYPVTCDDEIVFQGVDTAGLTFSLRILNQSGDTLVSIPLDEYDGIYTTSFVLSELSPEICNAKIQIKIFDETESPEVEILQSDALNIKEDHEESVLIEYSNNRNYAGLIYEDVSPELSFFLRVPAVFFHERFLQEDRAMERTSSTIITSSKLKKQRLMQVLHAPNYFHEKLILALSHQNLTIDGKIWRKEEPYEKEDGDLRYPLKKATVYLTEKNFLARNVL